jgi:hypothetical protein
MTPCEEDETGKIFVLWRDCATRVGAARVVYSALNLGEISQKSTDLLLPNAWSAISICSLVASY